MRMHGQIPTFTNQHSVLASYLGANKRPVRSVLVFLPFVLLFLSFHTLLSAFAQTRLHPFVALANHQPPTTPHIHNSNSIQIKIIHKIHYMYMYGNISHYFTRQLMAFYRYIPVIMLAGDHCCFFFFTGGVT